MTNTFAPDDSASSADSSVSEARSLRVPSSESPQSANIPQNTATSQNSDTPQKPEQSSHPQDNSPKKWKSTVRTLGIASVVFLVALAATTVSVPYVAQKPGPTVDVGGEFSGQAVLDIKDTDVTGKKLSLDPVHKSNDDNGELRIVTVQEQGGPGYPMSTVELIVNWFDSRVDILPYSQVYPEGVTSKDVEDRGKAQMVTAQSTATVAGLQAAGYDIPARIKILAAVPGSDAEGKVKEGDILTSITTSDGVKHEVNGPEVPFAVLRTVAPGDTITVEVNRGGQTLEQRIVTTPAESWDKGSKIGIFLEPEMTLPVDVKIDLENIMGPSAGLIFSLGIVDRLTPGDLTGGKKIAGTGTMAFDGTVGPIGGVRQKIWGASRDGASVFLAPVANCAEVTGELPSDLRVVPVESLQQALGVVKDVAENRMDSLPTCPAMN